jgi:hypothetical protein
MRSRQCVQKVIGATCGIALATAILGARTQEPAPAPPARQFKNVQVMKDIAFEQMNPAMHLIAGQLGVGCTYCHVWEQWEREDKPQKQVARGMMALTAAINRTSFGGAQLVNCYTCHRGSPKPATMVALPVPPPPHYTLTEPPPPPVLPDVDTVLGNFVAALGGEAALRRITSYVITGTREVPLGPAGLDPMPGEFTIYQKAPNLRLSVSRTERATISDGFDGMAAWAQNAAGAVNVLQQPDQGRARRTANFYEALELRRNYSRMEVAAIETVGPRKAYEVVGYPEGDTPERLYFDTQTGLLLRRAVYLETVAGPSPFQVDFEDYRDVGRGVKMPFLIRMNPAGQRLELGTSSTFRVNRIQTNVAIDDSRFTRPQPRASPPAAR